MTLTEDLMQAALSAPRRAQGARPARTEGEAGGRTCRAGHGTVLDPEGMREAARGFLLFPVALASAGS